MLLMIGTLLFQNVNRIDWGDIKDAAPAFCVLFFIPFMYSVVEGVTVGYYVYILINLCTGDLLYLLAEFLIVYVPCTESYINQLKGYGYIAKHRSVSIAEDYIIDGVGVDNSRPRSSSRTRATSTSLNTYQFGAGGSSSNDGIGAASANQGTVHTYLTLCLFPLHKLFVISHFNFTFTSTLIVLTGIGYIGKHRSVSMAAEDYITDAEGVDGGNNRPRNSSRSHATSISLNAYQFGAGGSSSNDGVGTITGSQGTADT